MSRLAIGIAMALGLTACGGGGSGIANGPPAGAYDLQTAMAAFVKSASSAKVALSGTVIANGTSVPFTGVGTLTTSAGVSGTFNIRNTMRRRRPS